VRRDRDFVQIKAPVAPVTLTVSAAAPGAWGDAISVRARPAVSTLGLLADPGEGEGFSTQVATQAAANSAIVIVRAVPGLSAGPPPLPAGTFFVQIGPRTFEISGAQAVAGQPDQIELTLQGGPQHGQWNPGLGVRRVRRANPAGAGRALRVAGASTLYPGAIVELDNGSAKQTRHVRCGCGGRIPGDAQGPTRRDGDTGQLHQRARRGHR
jgi:hypothetical protein